MHPVYTHSALCTRAQFLMLAPPTTTIHNCLGGSAIKIILQWKAQLWKWHKVKAQRSIWKNVEDLGIVPNQNILWNHFKTFCFNLDICRFDINLRGGGVKVRRSFLLPKCRASVEETLQLFCVNNIFLFVEVEYYTSCEFLLVTPPPSHIVCPNFKGCLI